MSPETDIFCFQEALKAEEVYNDGIGVRFFLLRELEELLPDFSGSFAPMVSLDKLTGGAASGVVLGTAIFHRKNLRLKEEGSFFAYGSLYKIKSDETHKIGLLQYKTFDVGGASLTVCDFHGIATWPKNDNAARLEQSKKILEFLNGVDGHKILCGDFNLYPDTKSIAVLGHTMKNLIKDFNVRTTRSRIHYEGYKGEAVPDSISDYMFVSPDIEVGSFQLPEVEVSDHLPLILDFSL